MEEHELRRSLDRILRSKRSMKATPTFIKETADFVKWIEDGGNGFGEEENPDAKVRELLTNDDMYQLASYIDDPSHAPGFPSSAEKAITLYGRAVTQTLYRGISEGEHSAILRAARKRPDSLSMTKARSFTTDFSLAKSFAQQGGGSLDVYMHSKYGKGAVMQLEPSASKKVLDYSEFMRAYWCASVIAGIMDTDQLDEMLTLDEHEFIVSSRAKFMIVSLEQMKFKL